MTHPLIVNKFRKKTFARFVDSVSTVGSRRPALVIGALLGVGFLAGGGAGLLGTAGLRAQLGNQQAELAASRRESQREINALAARLGELQAAANRLNALGERLTRIGQLQDGEFNFDKPVGVGGTGPVRDISSPELREGAGARHAVSSPPNRIAAALEAHARADVLLRRVDRRPGPHRAAPERNSHQPEAAAPRHR